MVITGGVRRGVLLGVGLWWRSPTHARPVLAKVRPSPHSQRNEPWVLTQRPLLHTPGKTSHSLMSAGHSRRLLQTGWLRPTGAVSGGYLPSQTSPFMRAKPREQLVSEETGQTASFSQCVGAVAMPQGCT